MAPADTGRFLEAWADDAAFMKQQPGFVSVQLHRGTAGSTTFVDVASANGVAGRTRSSLAPLRARAYGFYCPSATPLRWFAQRPGAC